MRKSVLTVMLCLASLASVAVATVARADNAEMACLMGDIVSVSGESLVVDGIDNRGANKKQAFLLSAEAHLFSAYGGIILPRHLVQGVKLKVWFQGKSCALADQPLTASQIMVWSKFRDNDWYH